MLLMLTATAREMSSALGNEWVHAPGTFVPIEVHGRPVLAATTGVGIINASLTLGHALAKGNITGVLNLGVAGSFDLSLHPLGSALLVEEEIWPEYGLYASGWTCADPGALGFALGRVGDRRIWDRVTLDVQANLGHMGLCGTQDDESFPQAKSITVSGVTGDETRAKALHARHSVGLENMEGFALAYGCTLAGIPFTELRTVSNAVGARPPRDWDLPGALAALGQATATLFNTPKQ